jgi:hypothetical protein
LSASPRALLVFLFLAGITTLAPRAHADFYIIVAADNHQKDLTQGEAINLFMGRTRAFTNGHFAQVFDLPRDNPNRLGFYRALTGMSLAQVNSYWARLMFAGQSMPPQALPDEAAMIDLVKHNQNGIGWISVAPTDKGLRALLILKDAP